MEEVTKKVAPGKINHKNAIKSYQIVLFSSKTATEWLSSSTVACWFAKHSETEQWTKKRQFLQLIAFQLPLKEPWNSLP